MKHQGIAKNKLVADGIKGMIFDCDGTLVDSMPLHMDAWRHTFRHFKIGMDEWEKIDDFTVYPEMNLENTQWLKPAFIDYHISFALVKTRGIRIIGMAGGLPKDAADEHPGLQYYTAISELRIYKE